MQWSLFRIIKTCNHGCRENKQDAVLLAKEINQETLKKDLEVIRNLTSNVNLVMNSPSSLLNVQKYKIYDMM